MLQFWQIYFLLSLLFRDLRILLPILEVLEFHLILSSVESKEKY